MTNGPSGGTNDRPAAQRSPSVKVKKEYRGLASLVLARLVERRSRAFRRGSRRFTPRATNRTAEKLGLLMLRRLREPLAPARLLSALVTLRLGLTVLRLRLALRLRLLGVTVLAIAARLIGPAAGVAILALRARRAVFLVMVPLRAVFETLPLVLVRARLGLAHPAAMRRLEVGVQVITLVVAEVIAHFHRILETDGAVAPCCAIHRIPAILAMLFAERHDDAIVVLSVLQIILGQNGITRRSRIARQRHIFLGNMSRRTADFDFRPRALEAACERIVTLPVIAATTSSVLLSLPHQLSISLKLEPNI
jgi:hypothetical protein